MAGNGVRWPSLGGTELGLSQLYPGDSLGSLPLTPTYPTLESRQTQTLEGVIAFDKPGSDPT